MMERSFYQRSVDGLFDRNLEDDILFFKKLHPRDDFARSISQHKCQVYPFRKDTLLLDCLSLLLFPVVILMLLTKKRTIINDDNSRIICYRCFNIPGSLPEALGNSQIRYLTSEECPYYLKFRDVAFLFIFFIRSILTPFLSFRVVIKVAKYRAIIDSFRNLKAIAITGEFDATSSALTQFCRKNDVQHYDFMQGEAFASPRASFFHFDKCFVWDNYYLEMFRSFGASPEQFVVSTPRCLEKINRSNTEVTVDYTYYLSGDESEGLSLIRNSLDKLISNGYICEVRPHPRWSDMNLVRNVFRGITIQDTSSISVDCSIIRTWNAISLYSTVLLQAYYNEVNVVIDDITYPDKFNMLESYKYIMLNKPHQLLSNVINRV